MIYTPRVWSTWKQWTLREEDQAAEMKLESGILQRDSPMVFKHLKSIGKRPRDFSKTFGGTNGTRVSRSRPPNRIRSICTMDLLIRIIRM